MRPCPRHPLCRAGTGTTDRAPDLVDRQFRVPAPNELLVADFTYVPLRTGAFAYTAFAIDAYAGTIVGWQCSMSKATTLVTGTIAQAARTRARQGHRLSGRTIHHSDAGSPYPRHRDGPCRVIGVARTPRPSRLISRAPDHLCSLGKPTVHRKQTLPVQFRARNRSRRGQALFYGEPAQIGANGEQSQMHWLAEHLVGREGLEPST
jgi:transposase InsO family protein